MIRMKKWKSKKYIIKRKNCKNFQKILKIKLLIKKNIIRRKENFPLGKDDWKTFEKNNPTIGLNIYILKR